MDESSSDEDEDPVIREIDMCLAKALAERLFLFQYPVRPSSFTYDHTEHLRARMKPKQQKVELELRMDIGASTYCFSRGEQIARAVDVEGTNQKPLFQGNMMDRHVLTSTRATQDSSKYVAAVYSKGALHITPVKGIVQLRPGFHYFDKAEENQKKAAASLRAENDESLDEEDELKPVQMRFAKTHSGQNKDAKKPKEDLTNEEWIEMQFHQPYDHRSKMERNLLHCHQDDFEAPEFTVTSRDYLKMLLPPAEEDDSSPAAMPQGVLSLLKLRTMEFNDQVKALLRTAKVLQFTQLCVLLGGGLDEKVVLRALEQYAMLVQGCWVVKSEVLHAEGTKSHISGIDAEKIWPTRDFVMFSFNRKRLISRKEVSSVSRLPTEELREVLEQMARQRPAQGWEFMLSTDNDFLQRHPEVSQSQLHLWKQKYKNLMEQLHITEDFFKDEEFKESDFSGVFFQQQRKPATPRRRITTIGPDSGEKGKAKVKRQRSRSQSSTEGDSVRVRRKSHTSDSEMLSVKEEPESPTKVTQNSYKTPSPPKGKNTVKKDNKGTTLEPEKDLIPTKEIPLADEQESCKNWVTKNSRAIKNITNDIIMGEEKSPESVPMATLNEEEQDSNTTNGMQKQTRKKKKRALAIESDDNEDMENGGNEIKVKKNEGENNKTTNDSRKTFPRSISKETKEDDFRQTNEKPGNEVEVDAVMLIDDIIVESDVVENDSNNSDDIFIPPAAAGSKLSVVREKAEKEKPPSEIFIKELKKFIKDSISSGCVSLGELKEILSTRQQEPGNILCTGVDDDVLLKCVVETGAVEVPLDWGRECDVPLDRQRVFLYKELNEVNDKFRAVVVDLFAGRLSIRRKEIMEQMNKVLGEVPSYHMYSKFMSEFCENHGAQWYLHGTYQCLQKYQPPKT